MAPFEIGIHDMRVIFLSSDKSRERRIAEPFIRGVNESGDSGKIRPKKSGKQAAQDCDVVVMFGVKSRQIYLSNWWAGVTVIMLDKGYVRHSQKRHLPEYFRVAVGEHQPTQRLMDINRPSDRWDRLNLEMCPWRTKIGPKSHILIAGSSKKYHQFYDLKDPTWWTQRLVKRIRLQTKRAIVYRPKPSWKEAVPILYTRWSGRNEGVREALRGAHVLITHGSNACFEAALMGVPSIILGNAVVKPISSTTLDDINEPFRAPNREQWLANLAYCQWTIPEFESGEAWATIRPQIEGGEICASA